MKKDKTAAPQGKKGSKPLKILLKTVCIILCVIIGGGVLFLLSWIAPWSYPSMIKSSKKIEGACSATVSSFVDNEGRLNYVKADDKDFTVMDITDVHLGCSPYTTTEDKKALTAIHNLADHIKPDLIIVTGDCIYSAPTMGSLCSGHSEKVFASYMDTLGIPWTVVFGNHESECYAFASREKMGEILENEKYQNCVFTSGPDSITGVGNQVIVVRNNDKSQSVNQVLMLIDSNDYTKMMSCYDTIHTDQIKWYKQQITDIADEEKKSVKDISSIAFFHIPVTEYDTAYEEGCPVIFGEKNENVCHPYDTQKDVFFKEMKEFGSTRAMLCGHDHTNNYCIDYQGILLTYGLSIDYVAYKDIDKTNDYRGATVISIKAGNTFEMSQCHYGDII